MRCGKSGPCLHGKRFARFWALRESSEKHRKVRKSGPYCCGFSWQVRPCYSASFPFSMRAEKVRDRTKQSAHLSLSAATPVVGDIGLKSTASQATVACKTILSEHIVFESSSNYKVQRASSLFESVVSNMLCSPTNFQFTQLATQFLFTIHTLHRLNKGTSLPPLLAWQLFTLQKL